MSVLLTFSIFEATYMIFKTIDGKITLAPFVKYSRNFFIYVREKYVSLGHTYNIPVRGHKGVFLEIEKKTTCNLYNFTPLYFIPS